MLEINSADVCSVSIKWNVHLSFCSSVSIFVYIHQAEPLKKSSNFLSFAVDAKSFGKKGWVSVNISRLDNTGRLLLKLSVPNTEPWRFTETFAQTEQS